MGPSFSLFSDEGLRGSLAHVRKGLRAPKPGDVSQAQLLHRLTKEVEKEKRNVHFTAGRFAEAAESYEHGLQGLVGTEGIPECRTLSVTLFSNRAQAFLK